MQEFTDEEKEEIRQYFELIDTNSDGRVGKTEFKDFLERYDMIVDEKTQKKMDQYVSIFKRLKKQIYEFLNFFKL